MWLLSRFTGDPTVGSLRDKKESCSTRRGLRVGTRFEEFRQTPRGRGFSLLGFILCLRTMLMLELVEVVRGRLIGPNSWDRIVIILEPFLQFTDCVRGLCGLLCHDLCIKSCCDVCKVGIG